MANYSWLDNFSSASKNLKSSLEMEKELKWNLFPEFSSTNDRSNGDAETLIDLMSTHNNSLPLVNLPPIVTPSLLTIIKGLIKSRIILSNKRPTITTLT